MLKLLIFGSLFLAAHAYVRLQTYAPKLDGRIVGGTPIDISEARYQVALLLDLSEVGIFIQSCGGAIINDSAIVSAAHCLDGTTARQWQVRAGSTFSGSGGQIRTVSKIVMHPGFDSNNSDFDISLLLLSTPLTIDGITTYYVPLPVQAIEIDDGASAIATGWGATQEGGSSATTLMKVTIPIVNLTICENAYANINPVTDRMICAGNLEAGGQDACQGDSGGPLTVDGVLIGITSWGYGCARPGYPGVWTRVPYFRNWIDLELESKK